MAHETPQTSIPWEYVGVTAYLVSLAFAFASQWLGVMRVEGFLYSYQTLVTGSFTLIAVMITLRQLRRERVRDSVAFALSFAPEMDALNEAEALLSEFVDQSNMSVRAALMGYRSGHLEPATHKGAWDRIVEVTNISVHRPIASYRLALEGYATGVNLMERLANKGGELSEKDTTNLDNWRAWAMDQGALLRRVIETRKTAMDTMMDMVSSRT